MNNRGTIVVSGASGLIGSALRSSLLSRGYIVQELSRKSNLPNGQSWNPASEQMNASILQDTTAVVHLSGEPIAQRWTCSVRQRILESRVKSTALLAQKLAQIDAPPPLIVASGINYYGASCTGENGDITEMSQSGSGFLASVCREWEGAAQPLINVGGRVVFMRTGVVLSAQGGALAKLLMPFRLGLGGPISHGRQHMSWIAISDLVSAYIKAIEDVSISGPVNVVSPNSISNKAFTTALARALSRPAILPLPAFVLRLVFGCMAEETLLADMKVIPQRLLDMQFEWQTPDIHSALLSCLNKKSNE